MQRENHLKNGKGNDMPETNYSRIVWQRNFDRGINLGLLESEARKVADTAAEGAKLTVSLLGVKYT